MGRLQDLMRERDRALFVVENLECVAVVKRGQDLSAEIAKHRAYAAAAERGLAEVFAWKPDPLSFGYLRWPDSIDR